MYPAEHQLNKPNSSDTESSCIDLDLSITYGIVSTKYMIDNLKMILIFLFP